MSNLFNIDFIEFLELLKKHQVEFLLVGGYAVILHGYVRSTGDMDLWVKKSESNYFKIKKTYFEFGAPIFSIEEFLNDEFDVWAIGIEPNKIDILSDVKGLVFDDSFKKCIWYEITDFKIPYIDFEDLIKVKKSVGRFKDLSDIEQLNKLKKD